MDKQLSDLIPELGKEYIWRAGDTFMIIAHRYRRPGQFTELLDLNKSLLRKNRYRMVEGDIIQIPDHWFPLPQLVFGTRLSGSSGYKEFGDV